MKVNKIKSNKYYMRVPNAHPLLEVASGNFHLIFFFYRVTLINTRLRLHGIEHLIRILHADWQGWATYMTREFPTYLPSPTTTTTTMHMARIPADHTWDMEIWLRLGCLRQPGSLWTIRETWRYGSGWDASDNYVPLHLT